MKRWSVSVPWPKDWRISSPLPSAARSSQAAYLCKADLVSGMVGEFPEVQGIMGREYALLEGIDPAVAAAIAEHYLPTQAGGELPASDIGAIVSVCRQTGHDLRLLRRRADPDRVGRSLCPAPLGHRHHQHHP